MRNTSSLCSKCKEELPMVATVPYSIEELDSVSVVSVPLV